MDKTSTLATNINSAMRNGFKLKKSFAQECVDELFLEANKEFKKILKKYNLNEIVLNEGWKELSDLIIEIRTIYSDEITGSLYELKRLNKLAPEFIRKHLNTEQFQIYLELTQESVPENLLLDVVLVKYVRLSSWNHDLPVEQQPLTVNDKDFLDLMFRYKKNSLFLGYGRSTLKKNSRTSKILLFMETNISIDERLSAYSQLLDYITENPSGRNIDENRRARLIDIFIKGEQLIFASGLTEVFYRERLA